jgi:subtilisin family serine protease
MNVGIANGTIDAGGNITAQGLGLGIEKATAADGRVGDYQWLQDTSVASPHATGVAALIATPIPCPVPATVDYLAQGRDATFTATCAGTPAFNGFYGHGAVDAYRAVTQGKKLARA